MSDEPFSALNRTKEDAWKRRLAAPRASDAPEPRLAICDQVMERIVNIYADGRRAYTGFLSLAALRLDISERALALSIDRGLAIAQPHQSRFYQTPEGDGLAPGPTGRNGETREARVATRLAARMAQATGSPKLGRVARGRQ